MSLPLNVVAPLIGAGQSGAKTIIPITAGTHLFGLVESDEGVELHLINHDSPSSQSSIYGFRGMVAERTGDLGGAFVHASKIHTIREWNMYAFDPTALADDHTQEGSVFWSDYSYVQDSFTYDGNIYGEVVHHGEDGNTTKIIRLNPDSWRDFESPYGPQSDLPEGLHGYVEHDGNVYASGGSDKDQLWRLNPDDWDSTASPYGNQGSFPTGVSNVKALASDGTNLYAMGVKDNKPVLVHANPSDPDSVSGDYGVAGTMYEAMDVLVFHTVT